MADWIIPFATLRGRVMHLHIGGASSETVLTGSMETFVTQEEDSNDIFMPVRTESGYIRFTDSFDVWTWRSIIPNSVMSRPVTLMTMTGQDSWQTEWLGYVQPQLFDAEYPARISEHEIPVINRLAALGFFDAMFPLSHIYGGYITIGEMLELIFGTIGSFSSTTFYFGGSTDLVTAIMSCSVRDSFLVDYDDDDTPIANYNCLELLEEICRFFGWSCREVSGSVFFCAPDSQDMGEVFTTYYGISFNGRPTGTIRSRGVTFTYDMLANTDNREEIVPGKRRITINAEVNSDEFVMEVTEKELFAYFNTNTVIRKGPVPCIDDANGDGYDALIKWPAEGGSGSMPNGYQNKTTLMEPYTRQEGGDVPNRAWLWIYDDEGVVESYNWKTMIGIQSTGVADPDQNILLRYTSLRETLFTLGLLVITCETHRMGNGNYPARARCRLRVGRGDNVLWWNGASWGRNEVTFDVYFNSNGIMDNRDRAMSGADIPKGYVCPFVANTPVVYGTIMFVVDMVYEWTKINPPTVERGFLGIGDFAVRYYPCNFEGGVWNINEQRDKNTYRGNGGHFFDDMDVDLIFASFNQNTLGSTLLLQTGTTGMEYLEELPYYGQNGERPETHLLSRMTTYLSSSHSVLRLSLDSRKLNTLLGGSPLYPYHYVTDPQYGNQYHPLAITHEWLQDITYITLIEYQ